MALTDSIGSATITGLAYVGGLARLTGGAVRAVFIDPFQGRKFHISRAVHQAMAVGVEALPIVSLISFFVGIFSRCKAAYQFASWAPCNMSLPPSPSPSLANWAR